MVGKVGTMFISVFLLPVGEGDVDSMLSSFCVGNSVSICFRSDVGLMADKVEISDV